MGRAAVCRASATEGDENGDGGEVGDELVRELRKALGSLDETELAESDERVLRNFVDDRKAEFKSSLQDLDRSLDSVQESIESRLDNELSAVESDLMSRIDAAVEDLRRTNAPEGASGAPSDLGGNSLTTAAAGDTRDADGVRSDVLPAGAFVVIAGATTPLGGQLVRAMGGCGWRLRALVPDGTQLDTGGVDCESVAYAPFAPTALTKSVAGADAVVIVSASSGGKGGIEPEAMPKLVRALDGASVRRVVVVSTLGVERTDRMPFSLQNMFGQLDKQRGAEQEVVLRARRDLPCFTVVRVGKLRADPPAPPSLPDASTRPPAVRLQLQAGDALSGDLDASAAAQLVVASLSRNEAVNASFSIGPLVGGDDTIPAPGTAISTDAEYWQDQWLKLVGPEVYRRPLTALPAADAALWLREWARRFLRPGQQLTTPIAVEDVEDGVLLRFLTRSTGYADFDAEESADDKWAAAKVGAADLKAGEPDGALLLVAEARPSPRVRVTRAEMQESTVVKEMSEEAVLTRLERDLAALEEQRRQRG